MYDRREKGAKIPLPSILLYSVSTWRWCCKRFFLFARWKAGQGKIVSRKESTEGCALNTFSKPLPSRVPRLNYSFLCFPFLLFLSIPLPNQKNIVKIFLFSRPILWDSPHDASMFNFSFRASFDFAAQWLVPQMLKRDSTDLEFRERSKNLLVRHWTDATRSPSTLCKTFVFVNSRGSYL